MAMTKKERAELEATRLEVALLYALRWTAIEDVPRDVPVPVGGNYTEGWDFNPFMKKAYLCWSSSTAHGRGPVPGDHNRQASQGGIALFSSRLLALRAMRHDLERHAARDLAEIDAMISDGERPA